MGPMATWIMRSSTAGIVATAVLVAASGCAAREGKLASRFVKAGEPSVTFDDPKAQATPPPDLSNYMRKVRALQSKATPKNSLLPTIESSNPELMHALFLLGMHESSEHHRLAAIAYRKAGVVDYAFKHFQRATVLDSCDAASYDGMARLWRDWGMSDVALVDAHRALHCNGKSAEIYNTLGTILETLGQEAAAERAYRSALALNPRATFALNNLCYIQMVQGNGPSAARFCGAALNIDANFTAARNNLALIDAKRGDLAGAEARLRAGAQSGISLYNVGVLRLSEGRYVDAAVVFDQAAATQPTLTIARQRSVQARKAARAAEQPQ
jgi:tetratricopeptide (TPR) repeat protein